MDRPYRRPKKVVVSLTSLLDLLFVMIFVSLIQQKEITPKAEVKSKPVAEKRVQTNFDIKATFNFYGTTENANLPSGKFIMAGQFNKNSKELSLGGVAWIERPPKYDMVPLSGKIDPQTGTFVGRVEAIGCKQFTLSRKLKRSETPISGEWVGHYDCAQGKTGLTLTIQ